MVQQAEKEQFFVVNAKTVATQAVKLNALFSNEKSLVPDYKKKLFLLKLDMRRAHIIEIMLETV